MKMHLAGGWSLTCSLLDEVGLNFSNTEKDVKDEEDEDGKESDGF